MPPDLVPVAAAVTLLGAGEVLVLGLALAYWNLDAHRERLLAVIAASFLALSVTLALKWGLGLPRPPASAQQVAPDSPVGFPSGHAIGATVVYGGSLLAFDRHRTPRVALPVAALVAAIGLSRVALGLHYLGDVLAGFAVGLAVLGVVVLARRRGTATVCWLAAACAIPALFVTGDTLDAGIALGGSLGAALGAHRLSVTAPVRSPLERGALTGGGVGVLAGVLWLLDATEPGLVVVASAALGLAFLIVALPALVGRIAAFGADGVTPGEPSR
jgi:membrane-associated phospholipid phosphatase